MTLQDLSADLPDAPAEERDSAWSRIAHHLAGAIARGLHAPGARLPSEHALARQFGVHRHTVRRALAALAQRGLVRSTQGSGTYVEEFAVELAVGRRTRHRANLARSGLRGQLQVLSAATARASAEQARALQLAPRARVLLLQVLGEGEGQPLHVSQRCFPLPRFARMEELLRASGSITEAFAAQGVDDYQRPASRITARMPSPEVAAALRQSCTRPVLEVTSTNVDPDGVPIEYACAWFAGDRVSLTLDHLHG